MQVWDVNKPAPKEVGGPFDLVLACNSIHACDDIAGKLHCSKVCLGYIQVWQLCIGSSWSGTFTMQYILPVLSRPSSVVPLGQWRWETWLSS